jgi:putative DNA primase/helicase
MTANTQSTQHQIKCPAPLTNTVGAYSLNDLYHAQRVVEFYGHHIRHCKELGGFLVWNNRRWTPDQTGQVWRWIIRAASQAYRADFTNTPDHERLRLNRWITRAETSKNIQAVRSQLQAQPEIIAAADDFDRAPWLFNVNNGTIDLQTGKLREHRPDDMITKLAPTDFNPDCPKPGLWLNFLNEIFDGNADLIPFIHRACGYALTGSVTEQKLFFLHGLGANGKTTFLETLMFVMGDYARRLPSELLFTSRHDTHPTGFADLKGCRLAVTSETEFGRPLAEATVKRLTGGDRLAARRMRQNYFEFEPTHKIFMCGNHLPVIHGTDHALWRRIALIPFGVTIPPERQDKDLPQKLRAEAPGILTWLVTGCLEWQKKELADPPAITDATSSYRSDMDVLGAFLADRCVLNPQARIKSADLYLTYTEWCENHDERPLCPRDLGMRLKKRGFKDERDRFHRAWVGLERKGLLP